MLKKEQKFQLNGINFGIEFLRFIFCLWIIIIHCSTIKNQHKIYLNKGFHIPTFFLISFYFYYPKLKERTITRVISRFERLLYPYILWPIIIYLINNTLLNLISFGQFSSKLSLKDIYLQIITGASYHAIFWFQFNLIFLSLFLTIISFIFKTYLFFVFELLGIISLYLHFSQINYELFISYHRRYQITLGSLVELTPLAIVGLFLGSHNLLKKIQSFPFYHHTILFFFILFLFKYILFKLYPGFMYPNILLNILASLTLFITFGSLNISNYLITRTIIKQITKFTGGIYYIHIIFRDYLRKYIYFFSKQSYFSSLIIYLISYIICYISYLTNGFLAP